VARALDRQPGQQIRRHLAGPRLELRTVGLVLALHTCHLCGRPTCDRHSKDFTQCPQRGGRQVWQCNYCFSEAWKQTQEERDRELDSAVALPSIQLD
jgi:hypothetical protein